MEVPNSTLNLMTWIFFLWRRIVDTMAWLYMMETAQKDEDMVRIHPILIKSSKNQDIDYSLKF